jgi:heme-degrading monooxygenase HmoA
MFIAMNRFRVRPGAEEDFEQVWLKRDVFLHREPGFIAFHLLKGPKTEEFSLYVSHSIWASCEAFENWTRSASFRAAHKDAGENKPLYIGPPHFEGFEVIQEIAGEAAEGEAVSPAP